MRYGIRGWRVDSEGRLMSTNVDYYWGMGELVATHKATFITPGNAGWPGTPAAQVQHTIDACPDKCCGFYSYSSLAAALKSNYSNATNRVLGVVLIGGKVMTAKVDSERYALDGAHYRYRSERVMLVALCDDKVDGRVPDTDLYPVHRISRAELKAFQAIEMEDPGLHGLM